jgi:hypothetical protein
MRQVDSKSYYTTLYRLNDQAFQSDGYQLQHQTWSSTVVVLIQRKSSSYDSSGT